MKKLIFFAFIFFIVFLSMPTKGVSNEAQPEVEQGYQVIPDEAIRLRILANSDKDQDQEIKQAVRDEVNETISEWVKDITDIQEARDLIQERLPEIESVVASVLERENENKSFEVDYGENVTFPTKMYGSFIYPAGEYEAVLITIGEGNGANWWCVLFPPLCFLDFSNGTSVAETEETAEASSPSEQKEEKEEDEVEVKFFLFKWLGLS
ncbi:stage II sporulation protein R [Oceanobacillus halotolerans]|uniref:stage II sporulation protein R n=1 Tax=Oceanobacillus halotolerans TaxID=2663380 RepID=UPI0013DA8608|nr:stage II sporulation protein R [Oceanobacillus halotolerans]